MSDSYCDTAQIRMNGHAINPMSKDYPQSNQEFCSDCGEKTITEGPLCKSNILANYYVPGVINFSECNTPSYCYGCGKLYRGQFLASKLQLNLLINWKA